MEPSTARASSPPSQAVTLSDVICTRCGCLCDDLVVRIEQEQKKVSTDVPCSIARAWFSAGPPQEEGPACTIAGRPASIEEAVAAAGDVIRSSRRLLVDGLARAPVEAQRRALELTERARGVFVGHGSRAAARVHRAAVSAGFVSSTWGEVRQRADVVLFWNADPQKSHPRHLERYSLVPKSRFLSEGRRSRTLVSVGSRPTLLADQADLVVSFDEGRDVEAAAVLQALARGMELDPEAVLASTGTPLEAWQQLDQVVRKASYGALFQDSAASPENAESIAQSLMRWTQDLNETTSFVYHTLGEPDNGAGLEQVTAWISGCAGIIDFSQGFPRTLPEVESAGDLLLERSVDAALLVSRDPMKEFSPPKWRWLGFIPTIVLSSEPTSTSESATVWFRTAPFGWSTTGTIFRGDGVALPLQPLLPSPFPSQEFVLDRLLQSFTSEA